MLEGTYPATLSVDYPDQLNRLATGFRIFTVIPIMVILVLLTNGGTVFPTLLMILFRRKYPRWWFDWNVALTQFATRVYVYVLLLRDEYPLTDSDQAVHIEIKYPNVPAELGRGMPLIKWFLVIPHLIVLAILDIALIICTIVAWFAILFTGVYPRGLFNFVIGVLRWGLRVYSYAFLLTTDQYPAFSLSA